MIYGRPRRADGRLMAVSIQYDLEPFSFVSGNQGDRWRRPFLASGIDVSGLPAADRVPTALRDVFAATPASGTPAPAPLLQTTTVSQVNVTRFEGLDKAGANGYAWGEVLYSSPVDIRTAVPPAVANPGNPDAGPGVTISGRGYVETRVITDARPSGSATVEQVYANDTDGNPYARPFKAPQWGSAFAFARNEETNPEPRVGPLRGTVNPYTWNGYPTDSVLMQDVTFDSVNGETYFYVRYEFVYTPWSWAVAVYGGDEVGRTILNPVGDQKRFYHPYLRGNSAAWSALNIDLGYTFVP